MYHRWKTRNKCLKYRMEGRKNHFIKLSYRHCLDRRHNQWMNESWFILNCARGLCHHRLQQWCCRGLHQHRYRHQNMCLNLKNKFIRCHCHCYCMMNHCCCINQEYDSCNQEVPLRTIQKWVSPVSKRDVVVIARWLRRDLLRHHLSVVLSS